MNALHQKIILTTKRKVFGTTEVCFTKCVCQGKMYFIETGLILQRLFRFAFNRSKFTLVLGFLDSTENSAELLSLVHVQQEKQYW